MSIPFHGKKFTFTQPDGTELQVKGWGNQRHAVFETLDGYTVVQDPTTGYFEYAAVTSDGDELESTGASPGGVDPKLLGLAAGARIKPAAANAKAREGHGLPPGTTRWEARRRRAKEAARNALALGGPAAAPPHRQTVGDFVGLCLLVQFPDVPGTITAKDVEAFCNKKGYTGFGNAGSVYDYFLEVSGGRLRYTSVVAPYYTAKHPRAYYTDEKVAQPKRARELIKEALTALKAKGFDFSRLTVDDAGYVYATNVFYAGPCVNNWAKGLWPHSYNLLTPYELVAGKRANDYQITNIGDELTLATFCHENGHMICDFPDLYDYGDESNGVGVYCLMCAGGSVDEKNPGHVGAYLKYRAGWADSVTPIVDDLKATAHARKNEFFLHAKNKREYFIIENRQNTGRDGVLPASGLAIWHVDELGDNENEAMTAASHYECALVQADGKFHLERDVNDGDKTDLFRAGGKTRFGDATKPSSRWWDGTPSNLDIRDIGAAGPAIKFSARI
jgi:M6 family metalloprotease-like protein